MNPPNQPLSLDLLAAALKSALQETHPAPYERILLNEKRWRSVIEPERIEAFLGIPVRLIHADDLALILNKAFGSYGIGDADAYLVPEPQYDQKLILEIDFRHETTKQIEDLLRSGEITVVPLIGPHQWWHTVSVVRGEGHHRLHDLICPDEHHGFWHLRDNIHIRVSDGDIEIMDHCADSTFKGEASTHLVRKYNVKVNAESLREHADYLFDQAINNERRANYLDQLRQSVNTTNHQLQS